MKWANFILTSKAQHFILIVIVINAITLGLETSLSISDSLRFYLHLFDNIALGIYVIEISLKLIALRFSFFKDSWNIFDFIIVGIAFVPNAGPLAVLRSLRILRALRLISNIPKLRIIVQALLRSIPSIGWISLLLLIVFYIFAVIATRLFGVAFPEWFGSLGATFYTLFQILTLESWSMGIARPVMAEFPHAYIFFVTFILITSFVVLNVFIAVIVNAMSDIREEEKIRKIEEEDEHPAKAIKEELEVIRKQFDRIESLASRCLNMNNAEKNK